MDEKLAKKQANKPATPTQDDAQGNGGSGNG